MCQEICTGSVGAGDMFGLTMGFTSIILEYPFIFLKQWKKINQCKYTFLFLNVGVELAWGKLENWCYQDSMGKKQPFKIHSFFFYEIWIHSVSL